MTSASTTSRSCAPARNLRSALVNADVVTARAVSALSNLAGLTIPLLAGKGEVVAIKGRSAGEEIEKAAKVIRKLGGDPDVRGGGG